MLSLEPATFGLVLAYASVALLLASAVLRGVWPRSLKTALIALVLALYAVTYQSLPGLLGWPAKTGLPQRFQLLAYHVHEPDKVGGGAGAIYLWACDLTQAARDSTPRAYRVPFTGALHATVIEAGKQMRRGVAQIGEISTVRADTRSAPSAATPGIEFFDMPDAGFPVQ